MVDVVLMVEVDVDVDIMRDVCEITKREKWKEEELANLGDIIKTFKRNPLRIFGTHQKSCMFTVKWHFLDHICADIKRNGSLFLCIADLFEYAHNIFERKYRKTTRILATEMAESI